MTEPTAPQYATVADLRAATRDSEITDDDATAIRLLQFATAKVIDYCGQTFPRDGVDEGVPLTVTAVVSALAARAWINPGGAVKTSETTGPFSASSDFGTANASVPMALRASEKDDLAAYKVRRSGISTIATYRPVERLTTTYRDVAGGGKPFPWPDPDLL